MANQQSGAKISLQEKRQTFRAHIRKVTIKQLLKSRRTVFQETKPQNITAFLSEERESIIQQAALQFTGEPSADWQAQVEKLISCLSYFQGNFESLLKTSILYNLSQLFTKKYDTIAWRHRAAILMSNIVSQTKTPGLVSRLLSYNFLPDLFRIFNEAASMSIEQCQDYIYLLSNIAGDSMAARNGVISSGAGLIVKDLLDKVQDYETLELLLWFVSNLVKPDDEQGEQKLKYNMMSPFLPALDKFIQMDRTPILKNILYSIFFLIDNKPYKLSNVFYCPSIKYRLIELLAHEDRDVRILCLKIISIFCESEINRQFVAEFIRMGLFDQLVKSLTMYNYIKREKKEFICLFNNIIKNSNQQFQFFIRHPIFNFAYQWLHKSQDQTLRVQALTIFYTVFCVGIWHQFDYIFKSKPETLGLLVSCLEQADTASALLVLRTIKCFKRLIPAYNQIYTPNEHNKIAYELQRQFNFESRFNQLVYHNNQKIASQAAELFSIYGQSCADLY